MMASDTLLRMSYSVSTQSHIILGFRNQKGKGKGVGFGGKGYGKQKGAGKGFGKKGKSVGGAGVGLLPLPCFTLPPHLP
jgi:hypothetical protein